jgi:hypothetical protein
MTGGPIEERGRGSARFPSQGDHRERQLDRLIARIRKALDDGIAPGDIKDIRAMFGLGRSLDYEIDQMLEWIGLNSDGSPHS